MPHLSRRQRILLTGVGVVVVGIAAAALVGQQMGHQVAVRAGDEKTVMARLTPVLPGLDPEVRAESSTYTCDDDASQPCHAVARSWSVEGQGLTLDRLGTELAGWARTNHLTPDTANHGGWGCAADSARAGSVWCGRAFSAGAARRQVTVRVNVDGPAAAIAKLSHVVSTLDGDRHAVRITVTAITYPSEDV